MPTQDGLLDSRDLCDSSVLERTLADESVSSLKIQANLQSDNFVTGTSGWEINRDTGSVEFQDATIRGTLNASDITAGTLSADRIAANTLTVDKLAAGTIGTHIIKLTNSASSRIESNDGTSLIIRGDGTFVGTSVTVTGAVTATSGSLSNVNVSGNLTITGSGEFRSAASGARIEIDDGNIRFYNGSGTQIAGLWAGSGGTGTDLVFSSTSNGITIEANGTSGDALRLRSVSEPDLFSVVKSGADTANVTIGAGNLTLDSGTLTVTSGNLDVLNGDMTLDGTLSLQDASVTEWQIRANTSDNFQLLDDDGTARFQVDQNGDTTFRNDAGSLIARMSNGQQVLADDARTNADPAFAFDGDPDTGMYQLTTNTIGFATNGTRRMSISSARTDLDTGTSQDHVMRVPVKTTSGNPTGAGNGDMYLNTTAGTNGTLRMYSNGAWRTVAAL